MKSTKVPEKVVPGKNTKTALFHVKCKRQLTRYSIRMDIACVFGSALWLKTFKILFFLIIHQRNQGVCLKVSDDCC